MHRLLERQLKRALNVDAAALADLLERFRGHADLIAETDPELARALFGLPNLITQVSESYGQLERDQALVRRSLELSSEELTDANQRLRAEANATTQALSSLQFAVDLLLEGYQEALPDRDIHGLIDISQKVLWLTRQRERMSQALKRSEERFELAMRGANDGLWDWDIGAGRVYYSPRWKAMIGYADDEIGDSPEEWAERIHPADLSHAMATLGESFKGSQEHYESTFRFRHKDGRYLTILSRAIAVRDEKGEIVRLVGTHSDITERAELERHLRQLKEALDKHAIVSIADTDGNIVDANDKFCEISGYDREYLLGKNHRLVKSGRHPDAYYTSLWQTISTGQVWHGELCNRAKDGSFYWVIATIAPILDDDGKPVQYISIRADITANKRAEESLRVAKEAAEAASRAKSEFLANVSHEIRTPMNGVLGMLDLALDTPLADDQRDYLDTARQSADALMGIINDILDLSKIEAGRLDIHPEDFSLTEFLRQSTQMFTHRCQTKGLRFILDLDPALPERVHGDALRLRQVLTNLLGNAVKFTDTGSVTLMVHPDERGHIRFKVRDTGIGIPPEKQQGIFEAFTQADGSITRRFGGTGLGLTISERLVRMMSGSLSVHSDIGQGSEFAFAIPLPAASAPADAGEMPASKGSPARKGLRILLAEDNPINGKLAQTLLTKAGHSVATVGTGRQAIEALADADYDLILMDMQMPDLDGIQATLAIRAEEIAQGKVRLPIVALTANAYESDRQSCLAAGMDDFLTKPLRRDELLATIARLGRAMPH